MDLPATPDAIDPAWLTAALAGSPAFAGSTITAVDARVIGVGYGLDGTVARLRLETRGGEPPSSVVAKFAGATRGRLEIEFYERIAPRMPIRMATFHAGFVDAAADRAVLLLEDLTKAVQGDAVVGASRSQAEAVLAAMAGYHAAFHGATVDVLPVPAWDPKPDRHVEHAVQRGPRFLERYGSWLDAKARRTVDALPARVPEAADVLSAAARTLVHSDLHLDNVLFVGGDVPVILDWPFACRGPAVLDVMRLLLEGMTVDVRRTHGGALLEGYARARAAGDRPCPSPARRQEEIHAAVIWHLARTVGWAGAEDPGFDTPRVKAIVDSLVRCAAAAASDLPDDRR